MTVGVLTELSGPGAQIGNECRMGLEFGSELLNSKVRLVFEDTKDDPATAISGFNRLLQIEKIGAITVTRSRIALPLNPIAIREKIPMVAGVGHPAVLKGNPYAIRLFPSAALEGQVLSKAARARGLQKIVVVSTEDDWTLALGSSFIKEFENAGGKILATMSMPIQETNVVPILLKMRQLNPDAVFVNQLGAQTGLVVKQLREQGYTGQLISNFWIQHPGTIETAGTKSVQGAFFAQLNLDRPKFKALFSAKFPSAHITPTIYLCYAGAVLLTQACGANTEGCFPESLPNTTKLELLDETISFVEREPQLDLVIKELRDGKPFP